MTNSKNILRGEIYWVNLDPSIGSETKKTRPGIVISNNIQNRVASRIVVIPITSNINVIYPFESELIINENTNKAMADQIRAVDKSRIGEHICSASKKELASLDAAIKIALSLD